MLIFALDSTATAASVALLRDGSLLSHFFLKNGNTHSETLLPMAKAALDAAGVSVEDVDLFACSAGPGSFTGVRIGAATIKGLAFGKGRCVLGVSTLAAMARGLLPHHGLIVPVMDARRAQIYTAIFRAEGNTLTRLTEDDAMAITELEERLIALNEPFLLVGDGTAVVTAGFKSLTPTLPPMAQAEQNAVGVALLALDEYERGARGTDATLAPIYLRLPQAERERLAACKQPQ